MRYRYEISLALLVLAVAMVAGAALYSRDPHAFLYFGDAASHMVRARQFIDSQQTGLVNIGTVWLPLPHLLLLPAVASDLFFYSGIAGAVTGIPLLVGTVLLLFAVLRMVTGSAPIAWFAALLFALNPNVIYIALTPMNEISLIFFVTLGAFGLVKWFRTEQQRWIVLCSVAVLCATLCRYEAWPLAPFLTLVMGWSGLCQYRQNRSSSAAAGSAVVAVIPWLGILAWLIWNMALYDTPFKFATWTYAVGTGSVRAALQDDTMGLVRIVLHAMLWLFGPMLLAAGLLMLVSFHRLSRHREHLMLLVYCALPVLFILTSVYSGFVQIDQWWWNWRYFLSFGLYLSVAGALSLQEVYQRVSTPLLRWSVVAACCLTPLVQMAVPSVGVAVYQDALKSYDLRTRAAVEIGGTVKKDWQGGTVALLTGYGVGQRIMLSSGLPLRTFSVVYFPVPDSFRTPGRYLIVGKQDRADAVEFSQFWRSAATRNHEWYRTLAENDFFVLLERKE